MKNLSTVEVRNNFSDAINRVRYGGETINLMRRGKIVARLVPPETAESCDRLAQRVQAAMTSDGILERDKFLRVMEALRAEGAVTWDALEKRRSVLDDETGLAAEQDLAKVGTAPKSWSG